ncbi:NPP1 family protein [Brachybacterium sp. YJGR34]|uniref:NPP1 family protein n=1 Tax=Brachybacterium sp. YJGR34 TaxID=2059911 RepID=UPI000E0AC938|nr:NPP1 family protein [Brachybacterium sp. YJGR34]
MSIPTLPHDQIVGFEEVEPVEERQILAARFQPYLAPLTGCVPYPGVDAAGRISAGLPADSVAEGGRDSRGQAYSRSVALPGHRAIVYAWYFPKDCPSPGRGHRHDWEGAVVWLREGQTSGPEDAVMISFSYSQHGRLFTVEPTAEVTHEGRPMLGYSRYGETVTHSMWLHDAPGTLHPLIDWEDLPEAARTALNEGDYGAGTPLMRDGAFRRNVYHSWPGGPAEIMDLLAATR